MPYSLLKVNQGFGHHCENLRSYIMQYSLEIQWRKFDSSHLLVTVYTDDPSIDQLLHIIALEGHWSHGTIQC
jgi:hypothetical protein